MKNKFYFVALLLCAFACERRKPQTEPVENKLIGNWELLSSQSITSDTVIRNDQPGTKMIKIITPSRFAFFHHDLNKGDSSAITPTFTAGAGTYQLENNNYTESLEYCSYRPYEGKTFHFTVEFKGDTLIQSGIEDLKDQGIGEENIHLVEKYLRVKS